MDERMPDRPRNARHPHASSSLRIPKSVTVGFSGGIDSSVAALLMKERYTRVEAVTMWLYDSQEKSFEQIRAQSEALKVRHSILDFRKPFQDAVVSEYLRLYEDGFTPNPCIICNRYIKYGLFLETIDTDYLALGHYARKVFADGEYHLFRSNALRKDQSYNLYSLTQSHLRRILFPIGEFSGKEEVRTYYDSRLGTKVPCQSESMGACFLKGMAHYEYLRDIGAKTARRGRFVDKAGRVLGEHEGIAKYTIGQKPRIKKKYPVDGMTSPYTVLGVVCGFDVERNEVIIGEESDVAACRIYLSDYNILSEKRRKEMLLFDESKSEKGEAMGEPAHGLRAEVRLSQWSEVYTGWCRMEEIKKQGCYGNDTKQPCTEKSRLVFESDSTKLMRAPAPGQAAVLYIGDELIGGGIITNSQ